MQLSNSEVAMLTVWVGNSERALTARNVALADVGALKTVLVRQPSSGTQLARLGEHSTFLIPKEVLLKVLSLGVMQLAFHRHSKGSK